MYSTIVEHFITQQWFKHYVTYHFVSCIQTCRKRCREKLYIVNLRYYDCLKTVACVLVASVHFSWYQWFTGESIHVSELQVATAAQSYNLAPLYEFSLVWWIFNVVVCVLFKSTWLHMYTMYTSSRNSLLRKVIRCIAIFLCESVNQAPTFY